jgi:hypothetical protein
MPDAGPPQPDVFREAPRMMQSIWPAKAGEATVAIGDTCSYCCGLLLDHPDCKECAGRQSRWNSDDEWTVARVHASWHGRRHPEDGDLAFARAVLAELH